MTDALELTQKLIACQSITPHDHGCQALIQSRLQALGFSCTNLKFGEVDNLWARFGNDGPLLVFAGHTDVVPPGPLEAWTTDPFQPTIRDGVLFGRGAADMKSGLAAMITATERFLSTDPNPEFSIGFLITSDEEGVAQNGTKRVVDYLQKQSIHVDYCIVGEASSEKQLGDIIKNGRRGSLCGQIVVHGTQGHIAYPNKADNPIHRAIPLIKALCDERWDQGNEFFPPTSFQISNLNAGTGADNVIPGELILDFNFRYSSEVTADELKKRVQNIIDPLNIDCDISWRHSGEPFLTQPGELTQKLKQAINELTGINPTLSTTGGTSDGRFIAKMGCQVVEFGPINETIHKVDERIDVDELHTLSKIYERVLSLIV